MYISEFFMDRLYTMNKDGDNNAYKRNEKSANR